MSEARERMLEHLDFERQAPDVQRDRTRRQARATCDAASQTLLLSSTVQKLGAQAFTLDARVEAAIERVIGGDRNDARGHAEAKERLRAAHAEVADLLAQLRAALADRSRPASDIAALCASLERAHEELEQTIEEPAG